jgi:hypothetical protein
MYDYLKTSAKHGTWKYICRQLGLCPPTANRYIDFYLLTRAYPRLLICRINFEAIMHLHNELTNHIDKDSDLATRLRVPLRTTHIQANIEIDPETLPQGEPSAIRQLSKNVDWNGGWEIRDGIIEKKQDVMDESFSSRSDDAEISCSLHEVTEELEQDVQNRTISDENQGMFYSPHILYKSILCCIP